MNHISRRGFATLLGAAAITAPLTAAAESLDQKVAAAKAEMFRSVSGTKDLFEAAEGVLLMPEITKGGLIVGGSYGEGALLVNDTAVGYYSLATASIGFQAGLQQTSQALFFMTTAALEKFRRADGWEAGVDAEVTLFKAGVAGTLNSTQYQRPVIGVVFGQTGLLAGASFEGAKYSPIIR